MKFDDLDIVLRLQCRSSIRRKLSDLKIMKAIGPDSISDLLDDAAAEIIRLRMSPINRLINYMMNLWPIPHKYK